MQHQADQVCNRMLSPQFDQPTIDPASESPDDQSIRVESVVAAMSTWQLFDQFDDLDQIHTEMQPFAVADYYRAHRKLAKASIIENEACDS